MIKMFFKTLFLISFFLTFSIAKQTHFKISYDPDFAPFSYLDQTKPQGLLIDYWELWAKKNNYTVEFINGVLWDDSINMAKTGEVDFFLGTQVYEDWMKASRIIYETETSLFIEKESSKEFNKKSPYLLGVIGNIYKDFVQKEFPNSQIIIYKDYKSAIDDLIAKKLDLIYDDKIAIYFYTLRNKVFHKIKPLNILKENAIFQAISKDKKLISIFNKGFEKISKDELYDIENKWIINKKYQYYKESFVLTEEEKEFINNTPLKIASSKNWKPFNFQNSNGQASGISNEVWKLIAKKTNIKAEYIFYNEFTDMLNSIKNKKTDITCSVGKTKDREKYSVFTKPYIKFPLSIVTLKDENFIEDINYLLDKKIAVGKNFTAHKMLKEKYPQLDLLLVKNLKDGLEAVNNKEAFAYVDIKPSLLYNINRLGFDDLKLSGNTGLKFELRMMIRDDYEILQSIINKSINTLSDEELNQIINKWNNIQFEDSFDYKKLWIILFLIFIIFLILLYKHQTNLKRNRNLEHLIEDRTKELKELNERLEQRVEEKTKELRRANYLLDEAQKIARLGSFTYDNVKDELVWSDAQYKIFGVTKDELKPTIPKFLNFVHKDDRNFVRKEILKSRKSDKRYSFEFRIVMQDKSIKYLQSTSKVTRFDKNKKALFSIGTIFDLTAIKELEIQKREQDSMMAQQSKMAAMGEMLENIAHQWRQPLSVISTASTGVQIQLEMNKDIKKEFISNSVKSINEYAQYLSKTIDDFRNFFNPNKQKEIFNIKETMDKSLYLVNARLKSYNIEVIKEYEDINIKTLESEIIQICLNIFNNAIDALKETDLKEKYLFVSISTNNNNKLYIEIKDNAGGIPKKILNRVLEPYFTTKHKAQGTGIGLYMSNEIVKKHLHGELKVANCSFYINEKSYRGALFTIEIPFENNL